MGQFVGRLRGGDLFLACLLGAGTTCLLGTGTICAESFAEGISTGTTFLFGTGTTCLGGTGTTCAEGRGNSSTISWRDWIGFTDVSESSFSSDVVGGQGCSLPSFSVSMLLSKTILFAPLQDNTAVVSHGFFLVRVANFVKKITDFRLINQCRLGYVTKCPCSVAAMTNF